MDYMAEICEKDIVSNLPERPGQGRGVNIHQIDHDGTPRQFVKLGQPRDSLLERVGLLNKSKYDPVDAPS